MLHANPRDYKTRLCPTFIRQGVCLLGDKCTKAHSPEEVSENQCRVMLDDIDTVHAARGCDWIHLDPQDNVRERLADRVRELLAEHHPNGLSLGTVLMHFRRKFDQEFPRDMFGTVGLDVVLADKLRAAEMKAKCMVVVYPSLEVLAQRPKGKPKLKDSGNSSGSSSSEGDTKSILAPKVEFSSMLKRFDEMSVQEQDETRERLADNVKQLMAAHRWDLDANSEFYAAYKVRFGTEFPTIFGTHKLPHILENILGVATVKRQLWKGRTIEVVRSLDRQSPEFYSTGSKGHDYSSKYNFAAAAAATSFQSNSSSNRPTPQRTYNNAKVDLSENDLRANMQEVLNFYPQGRDLSFLAADYESTFGHSFPKNRFTSPSLKVILQDILGIAYIRHEGGKVFAYPLTNQSNWHNNYQASSRDPSPARPSTDYSNTSVSNFPDRCSQFRSDTSKYAPAVDTSRRSEKSPSPSQRSGRTGSSVDASPSQPMKQNSQLTSSSTSAFSRPAPRESKTGSGSSAGSLRKPIEIMDENPKTDSQHLIASDETQQPSPSQCRKVTAESQPSPQQSSSNSSRATTENRRSPNPVTRPSSNDSRLDAPADNRQNLRSRSRSPPRERLRPSASTAENGHRPSERPARQRRSPEREQPKPDISRDTASSPGASRTRTAMISNPRSKESQASREQSFDSQARGSQNHSSGPSSDRDSRLGLPSRNAGQAGYGRELDKNDEDDFSFLAGRKVKNSKESKTSESTASAASINLDERHRKSEGLAIGPKQPVKGTGSKSQDSQASEFVAGPKGTTEEEPSKREIKDKSDRPSTQHMSSPPDAHSSRKVASVLQLLRHYGALKTTQPSSTPGSVQFSSKSSTDTLAPNTDVPVRESPKQVPVSVPTTAITASLPFTVGAPSSKVSVANVTTAAQRNNRTATEAQSETRQQAAGVNRSNPGLGSSFSVAPAMSEPVKGGTDKAHDADSDDSYTAVRAKHGLCAQEDTKAARLSRKAKGPRTHRGASESSEGSSSSDGGSQKDDSSTSDSDSPTPRKRSVRAHRERHHKKKPAKKDRKRERRRGRNRSSQSDESNSSSNSDTDDENRSSKDREQADAGHSRKRPKLDSALAQKIKSREKSKSRKSRVKHNMEKARLSRERASESPTRHHKKNRRKRTHPIPETHARVHDSDSEHEPAEATDEPRSLGLSVGESKDEGGPSAKRQKLAGARESETRPMEVDAGADSKVDDRSDVPMVAASLEVPLDHTMEHHSGLVCHQLQKLRASFEHIQADHPRNHIWNSELRDTISPVDKQCIERWLAAIDETIRDSLDYLENEITVWVPMEREHHTLCSFSLLHSVPNEEAEGHRETCEAYPFSPVGRQALTEEYLRGEIKILRDLLAVPSVDTNAAAQGCKCYAQMAAIPPPTEDHRWHFLHEPANKIRFRGTLARLGERISKVESYFADMMKVIEEANFSTLPHF